MSPAPIWDVINGFGAYWSLVTALELGLFDAVEAAGESGLDAPALAMATGVSEPASVQLLAELLVSLGLLNANGTTFTLSDSARRYLVATSPASMAALVRYSPGPHRAWPELADTIRRGKPTKTIGAELAELYPALVRATAPTQAAVAAATARELDQLGLWPQVPLVVDLGCGSGAWLTALLASRPEARAVAVDLANVLPLTEHAVSIAGQADRVTTVVGDYLAVELPIAHADVVVLAHVLRAESPERAQRLLARAIELAWPSGVVVVADYPRPDPPAPGDADRTATCVAARHELLLSLTMLASTSGLGLSVDDLSVWSEAADAEIVHTFQALPRQTVHLIRSRREATS
ncbi:MAG: class I SAM-dependent methyltransferase [Jatrophihabitantaceae bacterium]